MNKPTLLLLAAAAALLVATDGLGEPKGTQVQDVQSVDQQHALDVGLAKATATLDAAVKLRLDRAALEAMKAREAEAQAVRGESLRHVPAYTARPPYVSANAPFIGEAYAPSGAAPRGLVVLFGANLEAADRSTEVHLMLRQQDLRAQPLPGAACTPKRCEVTMPDFEGITGLTPATLVVKQGGMTSEPASVMLKPELVTQALDLAQLEPALRRDFRGDGLAYSDTLRGNDVFRLLDATTIQAVHRRLYGSPDATGTDEYFLATQLKNNWVLKDVVFFDAVTRGPDAYPSQASAGYSNVKWGTHWLYVDVTWLCKTSLYNQSVYYLRYIVEGPKGTAYD